MFPATAGCFSPMAGALQEILCPLRRVGAGIAAIRVVDNNVADFRAQAFAVPEAQTVPRAEAHAYGVLAQHLHQLYIPPQVPIWADATYVVRAAARSPADRGQLVDGRNGDLWERAFQFPREALHVRSHQDRGRGPAELPRQSLFQILGNGLADAAATAASERAHTLRLPRPSSGRP